MLRPVVMLPACHNPSTLELSAKGTMELMGPCKVCGKLTSHIKRARECWGCRAEHHFHCVEQAGKEGPYYCNDCKQAAKKQGLRTVTLDDDLLYHVLTLTCRPSTSASESFRLLRAADWLYWDGCRLYCWSHNVFCHIPAICKREELVEEAAR